MALYRQHQFAYYFDSKLTSGSTCVGCDTGGMSGGSRDIYERVDERQEEIAAFLTRTGSIGLLREVQHMDGSRFTELDEALDVSSSTLSKRLEEACELGLLEPTLESTDYGTNTRYKLTGTGRKVRNVMEHRGIIRTYDKIRTLEEQLDESIEDLREWVTTEMFHGESPDFER